MRIPSLVSRSVFLRDVATGPRDRSLVLVFIPTEWVLPESRVSDAVELERIAQSIPEGKMVCRLGLLSFALITTESIAAALRWWQHSSAERNGMACIAVAPIGDGGLSTLETLEIGSLEEARVHITSRAFALQGDRVEAVPPSG